MPGEDFFNIGFIFFDWEEISGNKLASFVLDMHEKINFVQE